MTSLWVIIPTERFDDARFRWIRATKTEPSPAARDLQCTQAIRLRKIPENSLDQAIEDPWRVTACFLFLFTLHVFNSQNETDQLTSRGVPRTYSDPTKPRQSCLSSQCYLRNSRAEGVFSPQKRNTRRLVLCCRQDAKLASTQRAYMQIETKAWIGTNREKWDCRLVHWRRTVVFTFASHLA